MKVSISQSNQPGSGSGSGTRDAESIFRSKPVTDIRTIESETRKQIEDKKVELRQLIGNRYRDLIDSADSILLMKSSCESISSNIVSISNSINALSFQNPNYLFNNYDPNPKRVKLYGIGTRVKYLVDTPENIWGCLDECMFLEAAARYSRAKLVYKGLKLVGNDEGLILRKNFPLLNHQWQIVSSFRVQISQRSRERLNVVEGDVGRVGIGVFADALAGAAVIDGLDPKQVLGLFLDSRRSWILNKVGGFDGGASVVDVLCEVTKVIQVTVAQVGQMFLQVLNDMPLFYKVILGSPPASQLFGGIPNPDEEVRLWNEFREKLESVMVMLDRVFIAKTCLSWLRDCGREIVNKINGRCLIDVIANGAELASAEKLIQESMDNKDVLEGSLEWLKSVFGSDIELPWSRTRELVLEENVDLWDEIFEEAFSSRMKDIIDSGFEGLIRSVNVHESVCAAGGSFEVQGDFKTYLSRCSADGGVWFTDLNTKRSGLVPSLLKTSPEEYDFDSCLGAYFGTEASHIKDAVGSCCHRVLGDLLCFLESPKASLRVKDLAPYLQNKCYESISSILTDLKNELDNLRAALNKVKQGSGSQTPAAIVERSLFIGRLLFAFQNHSKHVMLVLGSPRFWVNEVSVSDNFPSMSRHYGFSLDPTRLDSPGKQLVNNPRRQMSLAANALFGADDSTSLKLDELVCSMKELCIAAHGLWISWVSDELANILAEDLKQDDGLSAAAPLHGWEEVVVKQEEPSDSDSDWKISLPSVPSLYLTSFLFRACQEVHRVGGHVLDKTILQQFARRLLDKIIGIYGDIVANRAQMSEKGVLQVLLDLRFAADILSGCDSNVNEGLSKSSLTKFTSRRKQDKNTIKSSIRERVDDLINRFSQRLDQIDWQTFEPYLWENEKHSYLRHAVLFGFFVQLNRLYTDTVQKLPTNSESNIMRCSNVPRFKYLPISAPALSSRAATSKTPLRTSSDDIGSRSAWKVYANGEILPEIDYDDSSGFGVATPFLKSFMQVGSRFGEGTLKLGSILNDARFKDKASAMSSFGDILPAQAAGLLSSFTASKSDY